MSCEISGILKFAKDENGQIFILSNGNLIPLHEFKNCKIIPGAKFVIQVDYQKQTKKDKKIYSFTDHNDYSFYQELLIDDFKLPEIKIEEIQQPEPLPIEVPQNNFSFNDLFTTTAASVAMILSATQQIRQKKKDAESKICCNNNKLLLQKIETELQTLKQETKLKQESEHKSTMAEIAETYRELKEVKDNFAELQEIVEKIVDNNNEKRKI